MKNIRFFFLSENFQFLVVKFSIYLNRRVFVMLSLVVYVRKYNLRTGTSSQNRHFTHVHAYRVRYPCAFLSAAKSIPYRCPSWINVAIYEITHMRHCYIRDSSNSTLTSRRSILWMMSCFYVSLGCETPIQIFNRL